MRVYEHYYFEKSNCEFVFLPLITLICISRYLSGLIYFQFVKFVAFVFVGFLFSCTVEKSGTHSFLSLQKKYSSLLDVSEKEITNTKLYSFIDDWYGVSYKYGGKNKNGIDCSGFASVLYKEVFGKEISGTTASICKQCVKISKEKLREGDLVFFKIESNEISHMGVYLKNNKFVHATTKAGVVIDDMNEEYYSNYFETAGRL